MYLTAYIVRRPSGSSVICGASLSLSFVGHPHYLCHLLGILIISAICRASPIFSSICGAPYYLCHSRGSPVFLTCANCCRIILEFNHRGEDTVSVILKMRKQP